MMSSQVSAWVHMVAHAGRACPVPNPFSVMTQSVWETAAALGNTLVSLLPVLQYCSATSIFSQAEPAQPNSLLVTCARLGRKSMALESNINEVLPEEMLKQIFHLLPASDLKSAVLVCKHWARVGQAPALWAWVVPRVHEVQKLSKDILNSL